MSSTKWLNAFALGLAAVAVGMVALKNYRGIPSDIDGLSRRGLIASDWKERFPHNSQPYTSTIIFVVQKTNPKHIKDWPDLIGRDITIVTPDPNTSGNGKLSFLAAWGSIIYRGGSEDEAREFITKIYHNVPILNQSARDSSTTFVLAKEGDVHLTWENEALREVAESKTPRPRPSVFQSGQTLCQHANTRLPGCVSGK